MTTKDLSKILCELAGIEPKYIFMLSNGEGDRINVAVSNKEGISQHPEYDNYLYDILIYEEPVYPNFETPENFVKLLELPIEKIENGGVRTLGYFVRKQTRKDFIKGVIESIERNYYANDIKQALQAEKNWRY